MSTLTIISIVLIGLGLLFAAIDLFKNKKKGLKTNITTYLIFIISVVLFGFYFVSSHQTNKEIIKATELAKKVNENVDKIYLRGKETGRAAAIECLLRRQKDTTIVFSEEYIKTIEDSIEKVGYPFKEK